MNRVQHAVEHVGLLAAAAPAVLTAITVSTTEDIIRGVIAVIVVAAVVYQAVIGTPGRTIDPWLQSIATLLVGYYFGLATKGFMAVQESVTKKMKGG